MTKTSATGGPLNPTPGLSLVQIEDLVSDLIANATGLPTPLIRPRYQASPPKQPSEDTDWCAFGIIGMKEEAAQLIHGDDIARLHVEDLLDLLCSFYGPAALINARATKNALHIGQNRDPLRRAGLALVEAGDIIQAADFYSGRFFKRFDLSVTLRQGSTSPVEGVTQIRNLVAAPIDIRKG